METKKEIKVVKEQSNFCRELMSRLDAAVEKNTKDVASWYGIVNHSQMGNDIIRLRRELNTLRKLLNPWGNE
jgi:hypothetical protein